jgi:hypothetical protein
MLRRTLLAGIAGGIAMAQPAPRKSRTEISIRGEDFWIDGHPTYKGRMWEGHRIEGMLMNFRAVQGIFDDLNPETRGRWVYPDTKLWDAERNTREFVAAMPEWRQHGILSFTVNLQGGSPEGYSREQPWENSAFDSDGGLRPAYTARLARILDRAAELGMCPIVGIFYFGQAKRLKDETVIKNCVSNVVRWLLDRDERHVMVEIANECDSNGYPAILRPPRIAELIEFAKSEKRGGRRRLVGTSFGGGVVPTAEVAAASDFLLVHGNGADNPRRMTKLIADSRRVAGRAMPIVVNEDDHFRFDEPSNHMLAAVSAHASWGYFDPGASDYNSGYQCPPVRWDINTDRKKAFFGKVKEITGA